MSRFARLLRIAAAMVLAATALVLALTVFPGAGSVARAATTPARSPAPNSPGPLLWTAPGGVDAFPVDAVTCPASTLCVGVDRAGDVLWSGNPAGGPRAWQVAHVDNTNELTSISCPSTTECVAVDGSGNVVTSTAPTGGASAWTVAKIDTSQTLTNTDTGGSVLLRGVSCPSATLCVAVDAAGNTVTSTNPTGGTAAWTVNHADTNRRYGCGGGGLTCQPPLVGIACPSVSQCAAVDFSGNILTSTTPTAAGAWSSVSSHAGGLGSLWGISCPALGFCASVDGTGSHVVTFDPAAPAAQRSRSLPATSYGIWCQSTSLCLASAQPRGGLSTVLGSYNPTGRSPVWSASPLGAINSVACLTAAVCVAGDDQGDVAAGVTTRAVTALLLKQLLPTRRLPTIPALVRARRQRLTITSPISAQVSLTWTIPGFRPGASPVTLASVTHTFRAPGSVALTLRLNAAGLHVFRTAAKRQMITATATFAASTGSLRVVRRPTFTRPAKHKPKTKPKKRRG